MIPKKIYLREADFDDLFTSERMVACDEPFNDLNVEYTDLSQIWHKASEEPEGDNWKILCQDEYNSRWVENRIDAQLLHRDWNAYAAIEMVIQWAYIDDLLPKGGEK